MFIPRNERCGFVTQTQSAKRSFARFRKRWPAVAPTGRKSFARRLHPLKGRPEFTPSVSDRCRPKLKRAEVLHVSYRNLRESSDCAASAQSNLLRPGHCGTSNRWTETHPIPAVLVRPNNPALRSNFKSSAYSTNL